MGKIVRFSVDGVNHLNNDKYRMIGYRMIEEVSGLSSTGMLSLICPNGKNSESLVIGSNGLITDITSTVTNITNNSSTTVINTPSLNTTTSNTTSNINSTTI